MRKNIILSIGAGLLGGVISHSISPQPVHAQTPTARTKEVRAETFVLVNEDGLVLGKLSHDGGRAMFQLFDRQGREIWSVGGRIGMRVASAGR